MAATQVNLYVGNLKWETTDDELFELFAGAQCEPATAEIAIGRNGRSRGYGLVSFDSNEVALKAINALNETEYLGRTIIVREDRGPTEPSADANEAKNEVVSDTSVYVGNLSWDTTDEVLAEEFAEFNPESCAVAVGRDGRSRGYATIQFSNADDASAAIDAMNGIELDQREIMVRADRGANKKKKKKPQKAKKAVAQNNNQQTYVSTGCSVFVGNLSWDTTPETLQSFFQDFEFQSARIAFGRNGRSRGFGTIMFFDADTASRAIEEMNGVEIDGRAIACRVDREA